VSNIIDEFRRELDTAEYEAVRHLVVSSKKAGLRLSELVSMHKRHNHLEKLGSNEDQIESLIVNLLDGAKSVPDEKTVDLVNQLFELKSESIAPAMISENSRNNKKIRNSCIHLYT
jgi:hypothetical protein